jgi:hypothetical protein
LSWQRKAESFRVQSFGGGYANVFVSPAIIEQVAAFRGEESFDKHNVRNLSDLFPFEFRGKDWLFGTVQNFAGVLSIKDGGTGAINQLVVSAVVNQDNAVGCEDGRRPGLHNS